MKKLIAFILALAMCLALAACGVSVPSGNTQPNEQTGTQTNSQKTDNPQSTDEVNAPKETASPEQTKSEYYVGDSLLEGKMKIVYMASGEYIEENSFLQPEDGNKYIFLKFAFENTSTSSNDSISSFSFEAYADGYAADQYYGGDDNLSATLTAGRATTGCVYFEVPADAGKVEIEYEPDILSKKKIKFIYEGEKDSGYALELNAAPTAGAYSVGDVVESGTLKITYLSSSEFISDNMFIQPKEGYRFISCEFEFENLGKSDDFISYLDFDCYADGINCEANYSRDDALSATLSPGRKTKGTVSFEVPVDAEVIEVEYLSNFWTSGRVVFSVEN